jgi:hypothetical protein
VPAVLESALNHLRSRQNSDGGFPIKQGGVSRSDTTAWALLALRACEYDKKGLDQVGKYLQLFQLEDGRVVLDRLDKRSIWVSYVSVLAWQGDAVFGPSVEKTISFILTTSGETLFFKNSIMGHDTRLKGWPWIEGTHSWVEPTVLAMLALKSAGLERHPRYLEGMKLLKDRELSSGGWNVGNTKVYGTELRPSSESTGMVLTLLNRNGEDNKYTAATSYLRAFIRPDTGPLSLAWALMGVGSENDLMILEEALLVQQKKGFCQTEWLSLLCFAWAYLSCWPGTSKLKKSQANQL